MVRSIFFLSLGNGFAFAFNAFFDFTFILWADAGGGKAEVVPAAVTGVVPGGAPMPVTTQLTRPKPITDAVKDVPDAGTERIVGVKQGHG